LLVAEQSSFFFFHLADILGCRFLTVRLRGTEKLLKFVPPRGHRGMVKEILSLFYSRGSERFFLRIRVLKVEELFIIKDT
jgi:hypothetical protein